jgi:hypothetical protein
MVDQIGLSGPVLFIIGAVGLGRSLDLIRCAGQADNPLGKAGAGQIGL